MSLRKYCPIKKPLFHTNVVNNVYSHPSHRGLDLTTFCIGQKEDHQRPIYDLYAVINHYGGMIGGHYTAYARLPNEKNSQRSDVGMYFPGILSFLHVLCSL